MTERLIVSLFYMWIIVHTTSGKKLYEQKNVQKVIKLYLAEHEGNKDVYINKNIVINTKLSFS